MHMAGIRGKETGVDLYKQMRDLVEEYFLDNPVMLGGPGRIVMCDESIFSRRKYDRGRVTIGSLACMTLISALTG